jgi:hypothetical protein
VARVAQAVVAPVALDVVARDGQAAARAGSEMTRK